MKKNDLIRLLLAVRRMPPGEFTALLNSLGASAVMPPEPMGAGEIEGAVKKIVKG